MSLRRRELLKSPLLAALIGATAKGSSPVKNGMPGPYPGRVIEVRHPDSIQNGVYQSGPIESMMHKGMTELTSAPAWPDAWKSLFQKGDVVAIKVSPVGGPNLCSDALVLNQIIDGLRQAGVAARDIIVFSRYRREIVTAGIDKWLPAGVRWTGASEDYDEVQLDMDGYDPNVYMEMALTKPGEDPTDARFRRSHVAKVLTQEANKLINLPVLKHHQSAGVTICLKNMSHGMVNNVNRSHLTPTLNACGAFIPAVVSLPVFRKKAVLHICDAVKAQWHGGPGGKPEFVWEHKTMYFATDPVALDKTGLKALDAQRAAKGMQSIALSKPDKDSHFMNCQVEHIEIAGMLGLGKFNDKDISVVKFELA